LPERNLFPREVQTPDSTVKGDNEGRERLGGESNTERGLPRTGRVQKNKRALERGKKRRTGYRKRRKSLDRGKGIRQGGASKMERGGLSGGRRQCHRERSPTRLKKSLQRLNRGAAAMAMPFEGGKGGGAKKKREEM